MAINDQSKKVSDDIQKQADENITKMKHDVLKFCLELGWGCWIDGEKKVETPSPEPVNIDDILETRKYPEVK